MDLQHVLVEQVGYTFEELTSILKDLSDEQIAFVDARADERSIAGVAMHAAESCVRLSGFIAGKEGPRQPATTPATVGTLLDTLAEMQQQTRANVANLSTEQLSRSLTMPWGAQLQGGFVMGFQFRHAARHMGTIMDLRAIGGFPTHVLG